MLTTKGPTFWNEGNVERLKELWAAGKTGEQIARVLGGTRSMILGKIHRMDLMLDPERPKTKNTGGPRTHTPKPPKIVVPPPEELMPFLDNDGNLLTTMTVKRGQCRFPLRDEGEQVYCGNECGERVYCEFHHHRCHTNQSLAEYVAEKKAAAA